MKLDTNTDNYLETISEINHTLVHFPLKMAIHNLSSGGSGKIQFSQCQFYIQTDNSLTCVSYNNIQNLHGYNGDNKCMHQARTIVDILTNSLTLDVISAEF